MSVLVATMAAVVACGAPEAQHPQPLTPVPAVLVRTTHLSVLAPPSPDASGVTYDPKTDELIVVDSEVEEGGYFHGVNMWTLSRGGDVTHTGSTLRYTTEPTGVAYEPGDGHLFVSDDDGNRIFEVRAGKDSRLGTGDDVFTKTNSWEFGDSDTEDVAIDTTRGDLLLVDAEGARVYRLAPGRNGHFDGVPPAGDDRSSSFDVSALGASDVEGLTYNAARDTILLVSHRRNYVYEVSPSGRLLDIIDISASNATKAAGITLAPASSGAGGKSLYIVDRGLDNDTNPDEHDGALYELSVDLPPRRP